MSEEPQVFAVHPKTWCEHLAEHVRPAPLELSANPPCTVCQDSAESWFCLTCYQVCLSTRQYNILLCFYFLLTSCLNLTSKNFEIASYINFEIASYINIECSSAVLLALRQGTRTSSRSRRDTSHDIEHVRSKCVVLRL